MYRCSACGSELTEVVILVTECCGAEITDEEEACPACGKKHPLVVEAEPQFRCSACGRVE
jgi:hypothetical protein